MPEMESMQTKSDPAKVMSVSNVITRLSMTFRKIITTKCARKQTMIIAKVFASPKMAFVNQINCKICSIKQISTLLEEQVNIILSMDGRTSKTHIHRNITLNQR